MFKKEEASSFKYWFAHLCAFNMTALNLKCWKFKYIFHDFEKPWLKLYIGYKNTHNFHVKHSRHHIEHWINSNFNDNKIDWQAMVIDWECARFTKEFAQLNARETLDMQCKKLRNEYHENIISDARIQVFKENIEKVLEKLGL